MRRYLTLLVPLFCLAPPPVHAQDPAALSVRLAAMTAVSGFERPMADTLLALLPGAARDRAGNVVDVLGTGQGGLLIACPLDEVGYIVGSVRSDGWLTLRRVGSGVDAGFDRWLQGERVTLWGRYGARVGVVAVRSVHLLRGRDRAAPAFTVDDALVDVGARDAADARALGVDVLTPVAREKDPLRYGDGRLAGPWVGRRSACAALADAARAAHPTGRVVIAFVTEQQLGRRGLLTVMHTLGAFDRTVLVDGKAGEFGSLIVTADSGLGAREPGLGTVSRLDLPVKYAGTPVETVSLADVRTLTAQLVGRIGGAE